jgi:hypothetical protein
VHPNDIYVRHRMDEFRDEAARQRLVRRAATMPNVERGGDRVGRMLRPVRAVAMAVGLILVRIGVALGASPMDNA